MTAIGTLPVVLGTGIHSARPAASAVGKGGLYSCTTHSLVYQTDGSTWSTWATLGAALPQALGTSDSPQFAGVNVGHASDTTLTRASAGVLAVEGTNVVLAGAATGSGLTMATGKILGRTSASTGAIEELSAGTNITLSGGTISASGGGGMSHATAGTTSAGGSFAAPSSGTTYLKKVTLASAAFMANVNAHVKGDGNPCGLGVHLYDDSSGSPLNVVASGRPTGSDSSGGISTNNLQINSTARWVAMPLGVWLASGDYWLAVSLSPGGTGANSIQLAYASGSGSDKTQAHALRDLDISIVGTSSTSNDYSIFADLLS